MLKETVEEKNNQISSFEAKILNMESSFQAKLTALEKLINNSENKFKCDKCKFTTNSETGLKSHISKKHKKEI